MASIIDQNDVERFVSNVWSMTMALTPGARACAEVLRSMSGFLQKFSETLDKGSPEFICVRSHNAVLRQLITMAPSPKGIPVEDLRHVGKSILEYICYDLLFDDGDMTDEEDPEGDDYDEEEDGGAYNHNEFIRQMAALSAGSGGPSGSTTTPTEDPEEGEEETHQEQPTEVEEVD